MAPTQGEHEKFEGDAQPITPDEMMAEFVMFGHGEPGEDEESQTFAADVKRLNQGWKPGDVPRLPDGYRSGAAYRAVVAGGAGPAVEPRPRERVAARPRERARGRSRVTRAGPSGDDGPEPPASPFQAAHRVLLRLTARELDTLADIAVRRAMLLRARRWAA